LGFGGAAGARAKGAGTAIAAGRLAFKASMVAFSCSISWPKAARSRAIV
jgi:hypothetical protein